MYINWNSATYEPIMTFIIVVNVLHMYIYIYIYIYVSYIYVYIYIWIWIKWHIICYLYTTLVGNQGHLLKLRNQDTDHIRSDLRTALRAASWGIHQNRAGSSSMMLEHTGGYSNGTYYYIYKLIPEHLVEDIHVHLETNWYPYLFSHLVSQLSME